MDTRNPGSIGSSIARQCAVKKSIVTKDVQFLDTLLQAGFPMYEANGEGQSVLIDVIDQSCDVDMADQIFELFLQKHNYDVLRRTNWVKKEEKNSVLSSHILPSVNIR